MKKLPLLAYKIFFILILFCLLGESTQSQCNISYRINGPMVFANSNCSAPHTNNYYMTPNVSSGNSNVWNCYPAGSGSVISPTCSTATVIWNTAGGYLVYNGNGINDTLFMQNECCPYPSHTTVVTDLDDQIVGTAGVAAAFNGTIGASGEVIVTGGTDYLIQGMCNLSQTAIWFNSCNVYMGSGAVIYTKKGLIGNPFVPTFHVNLSTFKGLCGIWEGIYAPDDGWVLLEEQSTFSDAEFFMRMDKCELLMQTFDCTFSRNFSSIYTPENPGSNENSFTNLGNPFYHSSIRNCLFDGTDPITLPAFNGQANLIQNQQSFCGMLLFNLKSRNGIDPSIPFATDLLSHNTFTNLNYGIYAVNSRVDVFNCRFTTIFPTAGYISKTNGTAIYSIVTDGTNRILNVGDINTGTDLFQNSFTDCYRGVWAVNKLNSTVKYNSFHHLMLSLPHVVYSGIGIGIISADKNNIVIQNNDFKEDYITGGSAFESTAIYMTNKIQTLNYTDISYNIINDWRIGIYVNNFRGTDDRSFDFMIHDNYIYSNLSHSWINQLGYFHYGIWENNGLYSNTGINFISRSVGLTGAANNFVDLMLGFNLKDIQSSNITYNNVVNYGTAFRFVSNCNNTDVHCNYQETCVQGVNLSAAAMTPIGGPGRPSDNEWIGFPTPTATTYNRADGTTVNTIDWYNRNPSNTTIFFNQYSPEPVDGSIILPHPNETGALCLADDDGGEGLREKLRGISTQATSYPDAESEYLDREFAYQLLNQNDSLRNSDVDFQNFCLAESQTNLGKFSDANSDFANGNYSDALAKLNIIIDENVIESNKKYTTTLAAQKALSGSDELSGQEIEALTPIAWMNAWEGGKAVFDARHWLMAEVDDRASNLRFGQNGIGTSAKTNISLFPNPAIEKLTLFHNVDDSHILEVEITDIYGRIILKQKVAHNNNVVIINSFSTGSYTARFILDGTFHSSVRFIVLK